MDDANEATLSSEPQIFFAQLTTSFLVVFLEQGEVNSYQVNMLFAVIEHFSNLRDRMETADLLTQQMASLQRDLTASNLTDCYRLAREGLPEEAKASLVSQVALMGCLWAPSPQREARLLGFLSKLVNALGLDQEQLKDYFDAGYMQVAEYKIMLPGAEFEKETSFLNDALLRSNFSLL